MNLENLSNRELLSELHATVGQGRAVLARLLLYLGEVEERRLDLESACSSLFKFCVRRLGMSEDEACRRVAAARLVRRFPIALELIARGEIHLTALLLLRDHLTDENHEQLLRAAVHKTKHGIQHLIAERFPQQAVPSFVQRLSFTPPGPLSLAPSTAASQSVGSATAARSTPSRQARAARIEPLSGELYKVQFTASSELARKLERAADLMRHQNPSGDLSVLMERAVDLLIAKLEKQRLGKTTRPTRTPPGQTRRGYVPRAVRRHVFERDGERCTFVDEVGRRCESRTLLELDHLIARGLGGTDDADNLAVRCRRHNALSAERDFGRDYVEGRKSEKAANADYPRQRDKTTDHTCRRECQETTNHPRQRVLDETTRHPRPRHQRGCDETALRALRNLGFKDGEARRALQVVEERRGCEAPPPIATVLREALSVLA